ncbi:hypothetical protein EVAR_93880_1 [Eumeta japonica]|uniref:Uncharacterized protein n=1 Tax=Eumeta variegata TaxID=151549 RepID=A0A4C1TWN8_EUMVA|nr:hypothetical protein EVAR_93880_1 [Eumeta japonica]
MEFLRERFICTAVWNNSDKKWIKYTGPARVLRSLLRENSRIRGRFERNETDEVIDEFAMRGCGSNAVHDEEFHSEYTDSATTRGEEKKHNKKTRESEETKNRIVFV